MRQDTRVRARSQVSGRHGVLLGTLLAMLFVYQADATIVNVALPSLRLDLDASGAELELVIGGYLLASATLLITGARLGHVHGYRPVFLWGVTLFGLASLCCGLAPTSLVLIVARIAQGVGGALAFPQVLSAIQVHFDDGPQRDRALSWYSLALASGAVVGQIAGGVLVSADVLGLGWRPIFLVNVPIAAAVVLVGRRVIPADGPTDHSRRLDMPGAVSLSSTVLLIVLPAALGREYGWPGWTWACFAASIPMLAGFLLIERHRGRAGQMALIDLHLVARAPIAFGLAAQATVTGTYYALLFTIAQWLQQGLGYSAMISGLALVPWVVAFGLPGRLPTRLYRHLPWMGCALLALAYTIMAAAAGHGQQSLIPLLLAALALGGFGLGTSFSAILIHLAKTATPRYAADISGVFTTALQIAGALGVAALGSVYLSVSSRGAASASHAFSVVAATCAAIAGLAAILAWRAVRAPARPTRSWLMTCDLPSHQKDPPANNPRQF